MGLSTNSRMRHAFYFRRIFWKQFGLCNDYWWPFDGKSMFHPHTRLVAIVQSRRVEGSVGPGEKSEPRNWNRVYATVSASSDRTSTLLSANLQPPARTRDSGDASCRVHYDSRFS